jgi:hypothetical protein
MKPVIGSPSTLPTYFRIESSDWPIGRERRSDVSFDMFHDPYRILGRR